MAIATNTDWEIRTTGVSTNGGGFKDLNPGTSVDYSQQDAAQLALSDISITTKDLTSVTGGFTAAMVGNVIFLDGGGATTGWYQIMGYTDTNNVDVDRNPGNGTGTTGNVGGAWKFDNTYFNLFFSSTNKSLYNVTHIKSGTYTNFGTSGANSMASSTNRWSGYNASRGDQPTGLDRPYLETGNNVSYIYWTGHYGIMENMRIDSTYAASTTNTISNTGLFFIMRNCHITRTGPAGAMAYRMQGEYSKAFQCEFESASGKAVQITKKGCCIEWCYVHDSDYGIEYSTSSATDITVENCIVDTCATMGILLYSGGRVMNTTIYNCGTGVYCNLYAAIVNSIIHTCTTGIQGAESTYINFNCMFNNTADWSGGAVQGSDDILVDPLLADPANQDFALEPLSPAFDAGMKLGSIVGLP